MITAAKYAAVYSVALSAALVASAVPVWATVAPAVPEINGSSISAALGLLAAGVLVLRARRRPK